MSEASDNAHDGEEAQDTEENEDRFKLGARRFVEVTKFRGQRYVNIRDFYKDGEKWLPTRKGIALKVDEWRVLMEARERVEEKLREMRGGRE